MILTAENYYSEEANREYMSESQYKNFAGIFGRSMCEARVLAEMKGEWKEDPSPALMVGSYVDAYFEGTLEEFKDRHPEILKRDGTLKAEYVRADKMIARAERDPRFHASMQGEKQKIMVGEIGGVPWKIKMDSYFPGLVIVDLKTTEDVHKLLWVKDYGMIEWVYYWGYDYQGAVYQEVVYQNTGKRLPFQIMAVDKNKEPGIEYFQIPQSRLNEAMEKIKKNLPDVLDLKYGRREPLRCENCDYCRSTRVLGKPIIPEGMPIVI